MGWKASAILIKPAVQKPNEQVLADLGFAVDSPADPEPFEIAINPTDDRFFVGQYQDCTIVTGEILTMDVFASERSPMEQKLLALSHNHEIMAVTLHSGMNLWGYIVFNDGRRIRQRLGDSEGGTSLDIGEPLQEELVLLSKSVQHPNGQRTYILSTDQEESYTEDQVGENFVFEIFQRYTGKPLDQDDELLYGTSFEGYNVVL